MSRNIKVTKCDFNELPDWVDTDQLSDNGWGKKYAHYIVIEDDDYKAVYSDAMEPEDCTFGRDLKWIVDELTRAGNE